MLVGSYADAKKPRAFGPGLKGERVVDCCLRARPSLGPWAGGAGGRGLEAEDHALEFGCENVKQNAAFVESASRSRCAKQGFAVFPLHPGEPGEVDSFKDEMSYAEEGQFSYKKASSR